MCVGREERGVLYLLRCWKSTTVDRRRCWERYRK